MNPYKCLVFTISLLYAATQWCLGQQIADTSFIPPGNSAAYIQDGPTLYIDGGHGNFHTAENRFAPFAKLMERDGYQVTSGEGPITKELLNTFRILVISNALNAQNQGVWANPILPAFSDQEIDLLVHWVNSGGRLLLIADHMPFPGATANLAKAFGFTFNNGFARSDKEDSGVFSRVNGLLSSHAITDDATYGLPIEKIVSFTGQGFQIPTSAKNILQFDEHYYSLMPDTAWRFNQQTPRVNLKGWSQGAVMQYGKGKIAVFGEAAMFTAQLAGPQKQKFGFNSPQAPFNAQFALNVIHWLDDLIK